MRGPSRKSWRFSTKALWIVVILAVLSAGLAWRAGTRSPAASATARKGDVERGSDGRLLYFNGQEWTDKPFPAQDTPF